MNDIIIDKNIPVPPRNSQNITQRGQGKWQVLFRRMEIGDSFVLKRAAEDTTGKLIARLAYSACNSIKKNKDADFMAVGRKIEHGNWRIWKLAKPTANDVQEPNEANASNTIL